jgi:hypothetical protein
MKTSVSLQDPYAFMFWWLIVAAVAVVAAVIIHILVKRKLKPLFNKKDEKKPKIMKPKGADLVTIKRKYMAQLDKVEYDVVNSRTTVRHGYQKMSRIIRMFVYEVTKLKVQDYTLSEISELGLPSLTLLVTEYYEPEFAKYTQADIMASMRRTREVISTWY